MSTAPIASSATPLAATPAEPAALSRIHSAARGDLHRPFFLAAIALVLTLGATWGATLLWRIGFSQSFTAVSIHEVNAHGQAQIYGWVGLFIMGFAYAVFPRMWRSPAPSRILAMFALGANVVGVLLSAAGLRLHGSWEPAAAVALWGAILVAMGVGVFAMQMLNAYERRRVAAEPAYLFMLVAIAWFVLGSVFSAAHTWATMAAADRDSLIQVIGTYQAPLRDLQIHGLALTMILGVSLKMLPAMFGLPAVSRRRAVVSLILITFAVAGEVSFLIAWRWTDAHAFVGAVYACWLMLAVSVGSILVAWHPCHRLPREDNRSGKFVRAAYAWLAISLAMLLLLPAYQALVGVPFSHAYYGATRHAITVGFITMMIMGVASKFVPALNGVPRRMLSSLWGPFILVNLGCMLRVSLQTATDLHPMPFSVVGVSGVLEVAGLGWWSLDLVRTMLRRTGHAGSAVQPRIDPASQPSSSAAAFTEPQACCSACVIQTSHAPDEDTAS